MGNNGTYGPVGAYPTNTWNASNYFRDVVYAAAPPADTVPPSTPTTLSASAVSSSQINLTWTASTDNVGVTGYKIFRDGAQVGTSAALASPTLVFLQARSTATPSLQTTLQATIRVSRQHRVPSRSARELPLSRRAAASSRPPISTSAAAHQQEQRSSAQNQLGSLGTVIGGPTTAGGHTWWQVSYDNGISGWSISDYLLAAAANSSPAVGMAAPAQDSLTPRPAASAAGAVTLSATPVTAISSGRSGCSDILNTVHGTKKSIHMCWGNMLLRMNRSMFPQHSFWSPMQ